MFFFFALNLSVGGSSRISFVGTTSFKIYLLVVVLSYITTTTSSFNSFTSFYTETEASFKFHTNY